MLKNQIKYNLFVSPSLDMSPFTEFIRETNIQMVTINSGEQELFSTDFLSLFLIDAPFLRSHPEIRTYIESSANTECVILVIENETNCSEIDKNFVLTYLYGLKIETPVIKAVSNGFKSLARHRKVFELEKALVLAEDEINELHSIAEALSTVKDIDKLLSLILKRCIDITVSDAGSLYLVDKNGNGEKILRFMISDNFSLDIEAVRFTLPLDKTSISGYVASTKQILNIPDSYNLPQNVEYKHSKKFDEQYNYKTKSILTFPLINHKDEVIGVIQLVNKRINPGVILSSPADTDKFAISYGHRDEKYVQSLGSQAAIVLENALLYDEIQKLFEGFIEASVKAIESRDPTTSGHSGRVAIYTVELAVAVSRSNQGKYSDINFSQQQIKEIRYASLLHDFGKVGVRENVLVKAKKLYPDQIDMIEWRINYIKRDITAKYQLQKLEYLMKNKKGDYSEYFALMDKELDEKLLKLDTYLSEILRINEPTILTQNDTGLLSEIQHYIYQDINGQNKPLLSESEILKLSIPKGSLDIQERKMIEEHVTHTFEFLSKIPWTRELKDVPLIAYGHHEKLDGTGYPRELESSQIPVQSKMMTIADIYDALTASDRPYKRAVPPEKALDILGYEVKDGHVDGDLLDIFINKRIYQATDRKQ